MNLVGQNVRHKAHGQGRITALDGEHIAVLFADKERVFQFPKAFERFLTVEEPDAAQEVAALLEQEKQKQREQVHEELDRMLQQSREEKNRVAPRHETSAAQASSSKPRADARASVALHVCYCDGGKSAQQVGFDGACSESVIDFHIQTEQNPMCAASDCACKQFWQGKLSRAKLECLCHNDGGICASSGLLRDWKVPTGPSSGGAELLEGIEEGSLCILTTRDPGSCEAERYVFAVFLADRSYREETWREGYLSTRLPYKIKLSPMEAHSLPLWYYHRNPSRSDMPYWGTVTHRMVDAEAAALLLRDITLVKAGTADEELSREMFQVFCRINHLTLAPDAVPRGALAPKG
ncbi:MAG: hypothetical protein EOM69_11300 [Clostridia bacterium]|nr:hypothetical protein [Clostridia bacterium]